MSTDAMPDRYRPDPWVDATVYHATRRGTPGVHIPSVVLETWLNASPGDELRIAPRSPTAVTVGWTCPAMVGTFRVAAASDYDAPAGHVPRPAIQYLGVDPGDTVRFHRVDETCFRIERRGVDA